MIDIKRIIASVLIGICLSIIAYPVLAEEFEAYSYPMDIYLSEEERAIEESGLELDADTVLLLASKSKKSIEYDDIVELLTPELKLKIIRSVISKADEKKLAQTLYGEDRASIYMKRSAVIWCIFNRIDSKNYGNTVDKVVTRSQFSGWYKSQKHPQWAHDLVQDVTLRYALEKCGYKNVGRTLPKDYFFFSAQGRGNKFRKKYRGSKGYWDWSLPDPYNNRKAL